MNIVLKKRIIENPFVESFLFEPEKPVPFLAGQYFCLTVPNKGFPDQFGLMRELSVASSPEDPYIMFTVKKGVTGFKDTLFSLFPGDTATAEGPYGSFFVKDEEREKKHLFIAGGVGIAPFRSILMSSHYPTQSTLLHALKGPEDALYTADLSKIATRIPLHVTYTQSSEKADFQGKVTREMLLSLSSPSDTIYWICGSPIMIRDVSHVLESLDVVEQNIKTEKFTGYRDMV